MRQGVVWFVIGILLGSLFVVFADPINNPTSVGESTSLRVEKLDLPDHVAFILFGTPEKPLTPNTIDQKMRRLMKSMSIKSRYKIYALPVETPGTKIVGYGIKITGDGRFEIKIQRIVEGKGINTTKIHENLRSWAKESVKSIPDIKAERPVGVPDGYRVKAITTDGKEIVYSEGVSEPYWHYFGPVEDEVISPPYGNVYVRVYYWGLQNDNDPNREYFMVAGDQHGSGAYYRSEPGYGLRQVNPDYLPYRTWKGTIFHKWNLETGLLPNLHEIEPGTPLDGPATYQFSIGYKGVTIPISVPVPSYGMYAIADSSQELVKWVIDFDFKSNSAKYTFQTRVSSVGSVSESALKDGSWHKIVETDYEVKFANPWHVSDSKTLSVGWVWMIKTG
ncbi:hypothetical protein [Thermococcus sp. 2319x1]|uniref:hypothetical protein n=1 Tax=Thermococcus sp. 2319x1 TaxID=1674923 RepID=UPI001583E5DF|nr:hypothetical protein [Thermococcus sp. 2319x1]